MNGGNPDAERGRDPDEHYPTPEAVTRALCLRYPEYIGGARILEPCAAGGMMADVLDAHGAKTICSDIKPLPSPTGRVVRRADLFSLTKCPAGLDGLVTNPPWNIAGSMISHILGLPGGPIPFVAMVLKGSFWHVAKRAELFIRFPPTVVHPLLWRPDFKNLGAPTMEVCWSVWIDGGTVPFETKYEPLFHPDSKKG